MVADLELLLRSTLGLNDATTLDSLRIENRSLLLSAVTHAQAYSSFLRLWRRKVQFIRPSGLSS